jgi:ankyrin repeat protein
LEKHPERKGFQYLNRLIRESIANEIQKKEKCNNKDIIDFINVYKHILDLPLLEGNSLLYLAAKYGNLELVETLVACGARTDIKKDNGYTPIQRAALVNTGNVLRNFHQKMNLIESGTSKRKQFIAGL